MTQNVADALDALAAKLRLIDPSPEPVLDRVYVYPAETTVESTITGGLDVTIYPDKMTGIKDALTVRISGTSGGEDITEDVTVTSTAGAFFTADVENDYDAGATLTVLVDTTAGYPFAIVKHDVFSGADKATRPFQDTVRHEFTIALEIFLGERVLPAYEVESKVRHWYNTLMDELVIDPYLGGAVAQLGTADPESELLTMRTGFLDWYDQQEEQPASHWGIDATLRCVIEREFLESW